MKGPSMSEPVILMGFTIEYRSGVDDTWKSQTIGVEQMRDMIYFRPSSFTVDDAFNDYSIQLRISDIDYAPKSYTIGNPTKDLSLTPKDYNCHEDMADVSVNLYYHSESYAELSLALRPI